MAAANLKTTLSLNDKNFTAKLNSTVKKTQAALSQVQGSSGLLGKSIGGAAGQINGLIGGFSKLSGPMAGAAAGLAAVSATIKSCVENGAKFELALDHLQSLTGLTANQMGNVKNQILQTASAYNIAASEVADAYGVIGSKMPELLQSPEALDRVARAASTLAKAGIMPLQDSIDSLTGIMNQMGADADSAERYINVLAAGSKNGAGNIQYLAQAFTKAGSAISNAGLSVEQGTALIEALAKRIPDAAVAGTQLRNVLLTLSTKAKDDLNPTIVGLDTALDNLSKMSGNASEMVNLFGKENYNAAMILAQSADTVQDLTDKVTGTSEAHEQAAINTDNLSSKVDALKVAWENLTSAIGASNGVLAKTVSLLTDALNGLLSLANARKAYDGIDTGIGDSNAKQYEFYLKKNKGNVKKTNADMLKESKAYYDQESKNLENLYHQRAKIVNTALKHNVNVNVEGLPAIQKLDKAIALAQKRQADWQKQIDKYSGKKTKKTTDDTTDTTTTTKIKTPKVSNHDQKKIQAAAGSLKAYEKELQDLQQAYQSGLLPDMKLTEYLNKVKELEGNIQKERVRLNLDPDPKSLAGLRKTLQDIDNQIDNLKPGADPTALLKLRKETQDSIQDLEVTYKLRPAKGSLADYQAETQEMIDKQINGETNYSAEEFSKMLEARKKGEYQLSAKIGYNADQKSLDKAMDDLENNMYEKLSSFEIAIGVETPDTPAGWLEWYEQVMNRNDELIAQWKDVLKTANESGDTDAAARAQQNIQQIQDSNAKIAEGVKEQNEAKKAADKMQSDFNNAANAVGSLGDAFSSLGSGFEVPALDIAGTIAQAIAQIALGFAQASSKEAKTGVWGWIAASVAGLATMASMIAQIHSITGYAKGGLVSGGKNVGDHNLVRVNGSEMILTRGQQGRLWNMISGNEFFGDSKPTTNDVHFVLRGADLYGSINNYKRLTKK